MKKHSIKLALIASAAAFALSACAPEAAAPAPDAPGTGGGPAETPVNEKEK